MISPAGNFKFYVASKPVDFRKGMDGLAANVLNEFDLDPFSGAIFVFRPKRADRMKLIVWDGTGFVLLNKRIENIGSCGAPSPEQERSLCCFAWLYRGAVPHTGYRATFPTCGCCGGGVIQVGNHYFGCSTQRNKGTCDNRLTIKCAELEDRVLSGLKEQLLHPDLIAEFTKAYQEECNRLAGSIQQERSNATRDLAQIERKIAHLIDAISDGMFHASMKDKLTALEVRKSELEALIASASDEPPVLLHPGLSDVYQEQVANLTTALRNPSSQAEATPIIRGLLSEIRLVPEDGTYAIELIGELAGLLALGASQNEQGRPAAACSTLMVAGVGFEPTTFRL